MEKEISKKLMDHLYNSYVCDHTLREAAYLHPMFYNGTFSEDNCYQPPKPEELMEREEFFEKLLNEDSEYRWNTAFQVLFSYFSKENENKNL